MRTYDQWKTTNPADEFLGPESCWDCDGTGFVDGKECEWCRGSGEVDGDGEPIED